MTSSHLLTPEAYRRTKVPCPMLQVIRFSSPTSAGAECIDPNCSWIEQW